MEKKEMIFSNVNERDVQKQVVVNAVQEGFFVDKNYLAMFEDCEHVGEKNAIKKFYDYKSNKGFYAGIDCDVSIPAVITYCLLNENFSCEEIYPQNNKSRFKFEIRHNNRIYSGDTMTSAATVFKRYCGFIYQKINQAANQEVFTHIAPKTGFPYASGRNQLANEAIVAYADVIEPLLPLDVKKFLNNYLKAGNCLCIPGTVYKHTSFNMGRSNRGLWDSADKMLWDLYGFLKTRDERCLYKLFPEWVDSSTLAQLVSEIKEWLAVTGATCWDLFVERNCLQDFVALTEQGEEKYGRPIALKTGKPIDCASIYDHYEPLPGICLGENDRERVGREFETFFQEVNKRIEKRTEAIHKKIKRSYCHK